MWIHAAILTTILAQTADETVISVDASKVIHRVSPMLNGACIEDVNHEIYGGLYSQMIFGESFQEPPRPVPLKRFTAFGGDWTTHGGDLDAGPGDGPKVVADVPAFGDGSVSVEVRFASEKPGNAGMLVRLSDPGVGADKFTGYEVALEPSGFLMLGRHRQNWEPIQRIPWAVPLDRWIKLETRMKGNALEIVVDGKVAMAYEDTEHPLVAGKVGLRTWQRAASFRNLQITSGETRHDLAFEPKEGSEAQSGVSGMWAGIQYGAKGRFAIEKNAPFLGDQAQRVTYETDSQIMGASGIVGVVNQGLNGWGLNLVAGKVYEGYIWVRAERRANLTLSLVGGTGPPLGETTLKIKAGDWNRYDFAISPGSSFAAGSFRISLDRASSVVLGHVFLQPGDWGRFAGLPVRKDVAEALIDQGITVMRYGGSMVNHPQYRWKSMIGPRDRRPMTTGTWYPYSTNGWGIFDFLNFCEAARFVAIPDVNMGETPQDMADFVEYVNGSIDTEWGRKRASDGHPQPYGLKHLELGNEEAINEDYWKKFEPMARAIWARDPAIILVVGDFAYSQVIVDPYKFEGGAAAKSLDAHRKILELARANAREVWFDIHVTTDHPPEPHGLRSERSYIEQLGKIAPGAKYKVAFFEYNSGNHAMKRALSNALATLEAERIGDLVPVACVANCLQPDGQNDNGWDQGMLFLNPSRTWLQPPGSLLQMANRDFQPVLVPSEIKGQSEKLSVNAKRSNDGKTLVLQVVNWDDSPRSTRLAIQGFTPTKPSATVEQLDGPMDAANTAPEPDRIIPKRSEWTHGLVAGTASLSLPARSITFLRLE